MWNFGRTEGGTLVTVQLLVTETWWYKAAFKGRRKFQMIHFPREAISLCSDPESGSASMGKITVLEAPLREVSVSWTFKRPVRSLRSTGSVVSQTQLFNPLLRLHMESPVYFTKNKVECCVLNLLTDTGEPRYSVTVSPVWWSAVRTKKQKIWTDPNEVLSPTKWKQMYHRFAPCVKRTPSLIFFMAFISTL